MRRTRIGLVVGLAVVALAVAGCGGDDDEAGGTDRRPRRRPRRRPASGSTLDRERRPRLRDQPDGRRRSGRHDARGRHVHDRGRRPVRHPQLPSHRYGRRRVDGRRRDRDRDLGRHLRGGHLHVRLRPAREHDERQLRGLGLEHASTFRSRRSGRAPRSSAPGRARPRGRGGAAPLRRSRRRGSRARAGTSRRARARSARRRRRVAARSPARCSATGRRGTGTPRCRSPRARRAPAGTFRSRRARGRLPGSAARP